MTESSSDLDATAIASELDRLGCALGRPCSIADVTASTNDDARAAARMNAPHGAIFLADAQTSGRGRSGHVWHSPSGENVYLSLLLRPTWPTARLAAATLAAGVAVARVVDAELPANAPRAALKWPNDVLVGGRKIAGILAEAQLRAGALGSLVVGIGLNVRSENFPEAIAERATSLVRLGARVRDRSLLVARLVAAIDVVFARFGGEGLAPFTEELRERDALFGRAVRAADGITGTAAGIDADGRLLLRKDNGAIHAVVAGEAIAALS